MSYGTVQAEKVTTESGYSLGAGNASSFKNRLINGGMQFNQRYAASAFTNLASNEYSLDRWSCYGTNASKFTIQRSTTAPAGFTYSLLATSLAATTPGSTDIYLFRQYIEGNNIADLGWGSASAKSITISFWARSSVTGTYACIVKNGTENRSYGFTYTIDAANTFEYKTVTIPGDTTGGWSTDTSVGIQLVFSLGTGSSGGLISAGSWQSTNAWGVTGQTNLVATSGATLYITGVQMEVGTVATSFDFRSFGTELALCQRYFCKTYQLATVPGTATDTNAVTFPLQGTCSYARSIWSFPVNMRTTPTFVSYNTNNGASGQVSGDASNYTNATLSIGEGRVTNGVSSQTIGVDVYLKWHGTASAEF